MPDEKKEPRKEFPSKPKKGSLKEEGWVPDSDVEGHDEKGSA